MDFLDPKKKKAHQARLFIGYGLVAVALVIATTILAFLASGYDFDRKTGTLIQNGLIFVDAHPEPAAIFIDGQEKGTTDARLVIPGGAYTLELRRDGYRSWRKQFSLDGGSIERFVYPVLFPQQLISRDVQTLSTEPTLATQSPDRKWLLLQLGGTLSDFTLVELDRNNNRITNISVPKEIFTEKAGSHTLEMVEWSTNNRHVLLRHAFEGGQEYVVINRETPAESVNINQAFTQPFTEVVLRDKRFDRFYLFNKSSGELHAADLRNRAVTPLLQNVLSFKPHGSDTILFTTSQDASEGKVLAKLFDDDQTYTLKELPPGPSYLLEIARFNGRWYVVVGSGGDNRTYIYRDPFEPLKKSPQETVTPVMVFNVDGQQYVSFSANARFIAVQGGSKFAVYDAEHQRSHNFDIKLVFPDTNYKVTWMDGHRFMAVSDNKVVVTDFDGLNQQVLNPAIPRFMPFFDRDYRVLYTISPSVDDASKTALIRTAMRIEPQD